MRIASGVTDQYVYFVAVDATDLKTRETGLSAFTVYRSRNGGAAAAMTTPTINETDSANMPGVYELLLDEDMTIDTGDDTQEMAFHITHAGMAPVTRVIELYRPKITVGTTLGVASDGDISGNVDGNVVGSVASVTGNVTGSVGSISGVTFPTNFGDLAITVTTGQVTVGTNNDKTGYSISGTKTTLDALNDIAATAIVSGGAITTSGGAVSTVTAVTTVNGLAANTVTASALATDAVDEIVDGVWDEALTAGTHNVANSAGKRLRDVQESGAVYGGYIWIDTVNGSAGTEAYVNGTSDNPVASIGDANTLAASIGIDRFKIAPGSTITFAASQTNQVFEGEEWTLALGGQDIGGSSFHGASVSGIGTNTTGRQYFVDCFVNATGMTVPDDTYFVNCAIAGTITIGEAGDYYAAHCYSAVAGSGTPTLDINSVANVNVSWRHYSGGLAIANGAATTTMSYESDGQVTVNATCTSLSLTVRGNCTVTDNGTTTSLTQDAVYNSTNVADAVLDEAMVEATSVPGVTGTFRAALQWMFALSRNKITQTSTTTTLRNDADAGNIATSTVSDDTTTYTRGEWS